MASARQHGRYVQAVIRHRYARARADTHGPVRAGGTRGQTPETRRCTGRYLRRVRDSEWPWCPRDQGLGMVRLRVTRCRQARAAGGGRGLELWDLGCGTGKAVLAAALWRGPGEEGERARFVRAAGVELVGALVEAAEAALVRLQAHAAACPDGDLSLSLSIYLSLSTYNSPPRSLSIAALSFLSSLALALSDYPFSTQAPHLSQSIGQNCENTARRNCLRDSPRSRTLPHSLTHPPTHPPTHSLNHTHTHTHTHIYTQGRCSGEYPTAP